MLFIVIDCLCYVIILFIKAMHFGVLLLHIDVFLNNILYFVTVMYCLLEILYKWHRRVCILLHSAFFIQCCVWVIHVDTISFISFTFTYIQYFTVYVCACSVVEWRLIPCDPMECSPPGSSVHGIFQGRVLEWVATLYDYTTIYESILLLIGM